MLRAIGCMGLGAMFLLISPNLRETVKDGLEQGLKTMDHNSPWSYVGAAVITIAILMAYLYHAAQPR